MEMYGEKSGPQYDRLWLEQASQRAAQIEAGKVELISAEAVDRKAQAMAVTAG